MGKESLAKAKFAAETIDIEGESYEIREMTAGEASVYESSLFSMVNGKPIYNTKNAKPRLVLMTLYQAGARVYDDKDIGLVEALPYSTLNQLFDVASRLNSLGASEKN